MEFYAQYGCFGKQARDWIKSKESCNNLELYKVGDVVIINDYDLDSHCFKEGDEVEIKDVEQSSFTNNFYYDAKGLDPNGNIVMQIIKNSNISHVKRK